jgi:putative MATE family efflux protein
MILAAVLGVVVALAGLSGLNPLFHLMALPADADLDARHFLIVQCFGSVLIYGYFVVEAAFRSAGNTRTPFVLLAGSVLLNLVLDPLMILGLGPFPALGVYGAALATVLTRGFGFAAGLVLLMRRGHIRPAFDRVAAWNIVRIGTPVMLAGSLFSLSYILLVPIVGQFGTPALAALGVGHKVEGVSYMIAVGFGLAASTLVGQNLGAGEPERARAAGWLTATLAVVPIGMLGLSFSLWPGQLAGVFTRDDATAGAAALYLLAFSVVQPFIAFEESLFGGLSGAGYTVWPMVWVILLSVIRVPLALWAAPRTGLAGVWLVLAVTAMGRGLAMLVLWRWGAWETARA